ncbi:MAG: CCDC90 family protein [Magnetococcus sp. YQC-5]
MTNLAIAFDTHKFIKQMMATGFTEQQAESQVNLLAEILNNQLSTKEDVAKVDLKVLEINQNIKAMDVKIETIKSDLQQSILLIEANLKRDIKELDVKLDAKIEITKIALQKDIETAKVETLKWTAGMFAAQTALIIGSMFAMMKMSQPSHEVRLPAPQAQEMRLPVPSQNTQPTTPLTIQPVK